MGEIGILNVGAGDTKLTFDKNNPAETIRAGRIVKDMLRRGYALLVEIDDGKGGKMTRRVTEFREDTCEYIIADFDPIEAARADEEDAQNAEIAESAGAAGAAGGGAEEPAVGAPRGKPRTRKRAVPAASTRGVAVARTAGG